MSEVTGHEHDQDVVDHMKGLEGVPEEFIAELNISPTRKRVL